jgi:hypothetical protein
MGDSSLSITVQLVNQSSRGMCDIVTTSRNIADMVWRMETSMRSSKYWLMSVMCRERRTGTWFVAFFRPAVRFSRALEGEIGVSIRDKLVRSTQD